MFLFVSQIFAFEIQNTKFSSGIQFILSMNTSTIDNFAASQDFFALKKINGNYHIGCLIESSDESIPLQKFGIIITSSVKSGNRIYISGWAPLSSFKDLAASSGVVFIEAAVKNQFAVFKNLQSPSGTNIVGCNIPEVPQQLKGDGVVAGIIDSGIDYSHEDFSSANKNVKTRIISIWDQTLNDDSFKINPDGLYDYGTIFSSDEIASSITNKTKLATEDILGHGTHVAGIIAGNGFGCGAGFTSEDLRGVAPQAGIISVKTSQYNNAIVDGASFICSAAKKNNMRAVINISMGNHFGAHDGTSLFEKTLSAISDNGAVIVTSAGNDKSKNIHATKFFKENESQMFLILTGSEKKKCIQPSAAGLIAVSSWYGKNNRFGVRIISPNGEATNVASPNSAISKSFTDGSYAFISNATSDNNHPLGDKETGIVIFNAEGIQGNWWIEFVNLQNAVSEEVDLYIAYPGDDSCRFSEHMDTAKTLTIPATSPGVIGVGAYVGDDFWYARNGNGYEYQNYQSSGTIADFSSAGPTRRPLEALFGKQYPIKPEITAPGIGVISALSKSAEKTMSAEMIFKDGNHVIFQGTSMAAPHVSGAAILLLEKNKNLSSEDIKILITNNAYRDAQTGDKPNNTWGAGKLNAAAPLFDSSQVGDWNKF